MGQYTTVFLDMDEVLTDFVGGACVAHYTTVAELDFVRKPGIWSIVEPLGTIRKIPGFTNDDFWEQIHCYGEIFWLRLAALPWARELTGLLDDLYPQRWYIVSAPSRCPTSYSGKVKWLKRFFRQDFDRFLLTPHKHLFAKPGTLLIDDRELNLLKFEEAGGKGLLFPNMGNNLHAQRHNPLEYVRQHLLNGAM